MRTSIVTRIAIVSALAAVTGSTFVYAQQSGEPDRAGPARLERYRPTADDFSAFVDARIAAIKAGLRLTAEQEKNWPAFEEAYRNVAKLRTDRILAFREGPPPPPTDMLDGLQRRADTAVRSAAALKQIVDATGPLYKSLDEAQKRRFAILTPILRQPGAVNMRRGDLQRRGQDDIRRGGPGPDRLHSAAPIGRGRAKAARGAMPPSASGSTGTAS